MPARKSIKVAIAGVGKTESVQSQLDERLDARDIHIGPSDYVPWQRDKRSASSVLRSAAWGGAD
jgi:myo-inositol-1-phosphate synthase